MKHSEIADQLVPGWHPVPRAGARVRVPLALPVSSGPVAVDSPWPRYGCHRGRSLGVARARAERRYGGRPTRKGCSVRLQGSAKPPPQHRVRGRSAEALFDELGRGIRFVQYEYVNLFSGLDRGDFDFAMNGLEVTPDRGAGPLQPPLLRLPLAVGRAGRRNPAEVTRRLQSGGAVVGTLAVTASWRSGCSIRSK